MDPDSIAVADPLLYLCVRNFPENTTQDSLKELLISKSVEGFEHVDIIKKTSRNRMQLLNSGMQSRLTGPLNS